MILVSAAGPSLVGVTAAHVAAVALVSPAPVWSASRVVAAPVVKALSNSLRATCPVFPMSGLLGSGVPVPLSGPGVADPVFGNLALRTTSKSISSMMFFAMVV